MAEKIFQLVRPKSLSDSNYGEYEFLIRWIGRDGAEYLYMFLDANVESKIRADVINREDENRIESIVKDEEKTYTLQADDLSLSDIQVIGQMFSNKFVTRIKKDGTTERFATDSNSYQYRLREGRYVIEFDIVAVNPVVWK